MEFSVSDTGIGIPAENLPYIFDCYYQVDEISTSHEMLNDKGTGIGLSLVKKFTKLQKEKIEVESEEGLGATFRIIMPYQPAGKL